MTNKTTITTSKKKVVRKKNLKLINSIVIGGLVLILLVIWGTVAITKSVTPEESNSNTSAQKVEKTVSGKSVDEDRKDALNAVTNILTLSAKSPNPDENFEQRLTKLDAGDRSAIDPALTDTIRFVDVFADSPDMQTNTLQSLITFATVIQQTTGSEAIAPTSDTMWKNVYMDSETGTAFVPLALYAGPSSGFSFEMVYVDGEWKLSPYSILDAVRLSSNLQKTDTEIAPAQ